MVNNIHVSSWTISSGAKSTEAIYSRTILSIISIKQAITFVLNAVSALSTVHSQREPFANTSDSDRVKVAIGNGHR